MTKDVVTKTLGIIGLGAFGEFILPYVSGHFKTRIYDKNRDVSALGKAHGALVTDIAGICECDKILIATPVRRFEEVIKSIAPHLRAGQLVMDVGSVKVLPAKLLLEHLPANVDIISLHPLFGPQSGKNGIRGLNITVCNVRGARNY
jgi:prephenate dehydrogenase